MRYIAIILILCGLSFGQSWSGIVAPSRAVDWSAAGLPPTFPDGETTLNPWTPPTRTQCVTSQCNTVAGGSVTAATINAAITSAPQATYVLIPAGTFALGGNISITKSNVTLRGSGAGGTSMTKLTGGGISVGAGSGGGAWGGASFLTANPAKGDTSIQVAAPPTAGRLASIEQCDNGFTSSNAAGMTHFTGPGYANPCTGSYSDPSGPWTCGLTSGTICNFQSGGTSNPHHDAHVIWIPAGGVTGNTVNFTTPLHLDTWRTSRSAVLTWLNTAGTVGVGVEDMTVVDGDVQMDGTYACWFKGLRTISSTSGNTIMTFRFDSHSLVMNSYIAAQATSTGNYLVMWGSDSGEQAQSDQLFLNNILEGGFVAGVGDQEGNVAAYYYMANGGNSAFMSNGTFNHHGGTAYNLYEGVQGGRLLEDQTWATHNFNTMFRNYLNCTDPVFPSSSPFAIKQDPYARFANVVGNALGGGSGCGSSYSSVFTVNPATSGTGGNFPSGDATGLTTASLLNWANFVSCTGDSKCNTTSAAQICASSLNPSNLSSFGANSTPYQNIASPSCTLPASFYMNSMTAHPNGGTGLSWWKACVSWTTFPTACAAYTTPPLPIAGPDVTGGPFLSGHAYNNPAALVWAALPTDSSFPTSWGTPLRQFDERAFQADSGGNTPPPPAPSGVSFTMNIGISGGISSK